MAFIPQIELNPFVEADVNVLIKAYEEGTRGTGTEDGVIISNYGEIARAKTSISHFNGALGQYSGTTGIDTSTTGVEIGIDLVDVGGKFAECFPCDDRITLSLENMPIPDILSLYEEYLDAIKDFIDQMKNLLSPTNYYSDICKLLDALRFVCPQDLLILLALLQFLLSYYLTLSFQLELDWTAVIGLLLLPILLLIHALLQSAVNIGLGPLRCLLDYLSAAYERSKAIDATVLAAKNAVNVSLHSAQDVAQGVTNLATGTFDSSDPNVVVPEPPTINIPPSTGYSGHSDLIGKMTAFQSMLVSMVDTRITLEDLLGRWSNTIAVLISLLNKALITRMQLMGAITDIIRLIGFLKALISALQDGSVCSDPSQPLSKDDIESIIEKISEANSGMITTGTIEVNFDLATGDLILQDKVTDQSHRVPSCISAQSEDDAAKITAWIEELKNA